VENTAPRPRNPTDTPAPGYDLRALQAPHTSTDTPAPGYDLRAMAPRTSTDTPAEDLRALQVRHSTCPYCHTEIKGGQLQPFGCSSCLAWSHLACWEEHGSCPACGIEPGPRPARRKPRAQRPARDDPPWWEGMTLDCRGCGDTFIAAERYHRYHCPRCVSPYRGAGVVLVLAGLYFLVLLLNALFG